MLLHPFGSDWSSNVIEVVVGESDSIDHPDKSVCVRIVGGSTAGIEGNRLVSSVEKEKM